LDLVEMTPREMGRRNSYDEPNTLFHARQLTIRNMMFNLGIREAIGEEESESDKPLVSGRVEPQRETSSQQRSSDAQRERSPQQRSSESAAEPETRTKSLVESRIKLSAWILGENSDEINNIMEELYDGESSGDVQENSFGVHSASI
jgi:hypothetical protein